MVMAWNMFLCLFVVIIATSETSSTQTSCTDSCNDMWRLVATTSAAGDVTEGSKADLAKAVISGDELRVFMPALSYSTSVENARIIGDDVCAQALIHISKSGSMDNTPLRHTSSGIVVTGSVADLISDVKAGYDVRIATECVGYTAPMDSLEIPSSEDLVVGQALWHVSQEEQGPNFVFQDHAYWWFTQWSTNGKLQMSRWKVGDHEHVSGDPTHQRHMTWHTDSCWQLAYTHDADGNRLDGSLECLRFSLLNGHRVKLVFEEDGSTLNVEPDEVNICGNHINAVIIRMLGKDPADVTEFDDVAQWHMRVLTTTGTESSLKVKVGEYEELARIVGTRAVCWYTDTRSWPRVLSHDRNGNIQSGSKSDLIASIEKGRKIRYKLNFPDSDCVTIHTADNLQFRNNQVGAMHVRSVSLEDTPGSTEEQRFLSNPYWRFLVASTTGTMALSQWTIGENTSRGRSTQRSAMEWFVNM